MNKVILMGRLTKNPEIKYAGKEWTIINIVVNQDPFSNGVYSYELEVL